MVRTSAGLKGKMDPSIETIEENPAHSGGTSLLVLKAEILSALSSVGTATTTEELRQADIAYKKALYTARSKGYRPHSRATEGQEIQVEWVALEGKGDSLDCLFAECWPRSARVRISTHLIRTLRT
jgi:hypothetical protein